jgi:large repetitive protein
VVTRAGKRNKRRYLLSCALLLVLIAAQTVASSSTWVAGVRVPSKYRVVQSHRVASGVWHVELRRRDPEQVVHIARLERSSPHRLKVILSNGLVAGPAPRTEQTSKMCKRTDCLLAINGDFFADGFPVGGVVSDAEPMRSPHATRMQFSVASDETPSISAMSMPTTLVTQHPRVASGLRLFQPGATTEPRTTAVAGVNVPRPRNGIVLFTPRWGSRTGTESGFELIARVVSPAGRLRSGVDTVVDLIGAKSRNGSIPADGVVLSGRGDGAEALAALWKDVSEGRADRRAILRVSASPAAQQSVAGHEVLVHKGKVVAPKGGSRAPRTMIGWNAAGDLLMVTLDGRQPGRAAGLSLIQAADLMRRLGAVEALNLDGGGSTTFVKKGKVVNRPSGDFERRVAVAVAIVRAA